ncbi:DUF5133 domain-containing protein [Yinghuangia aomiensis]
MLLAHPALLGASVRDYAALASSGAEQGSTEARRRMADLAYALCVATGTSDVDAALIAARHRLPGAHPRDDSLPTS